MHESWGSLKQHIFQNWFLCIDDFYESTCILCSSYSITVNKQILNFHDQISAVAWILSFEKWRTPIKGTVIKNKIRTFRKVQKVHNTYIIYLFQSRTAVTNNLKKYIRSLAGELAEKCSAPSLCICKCIWQCL